jgi:hypothetical protein
MYTVYRLSSGGYYKYSGGGTPVYMWSVGYGQEGKDDVGETYRFRWELTGYRDWWYVLVGDVVDVASTDGAVAQYNTAIYMLPLPD